MSTLPTLFISHGAPTFALAPGRAGEALAELARELPRPEAILVLSPHWMSPDLLATTNDRPATIHDFGGFPAPLYELKYPAPGAPALAERTIGLLERVSLHAAPEPRRGLDHGAWVPLMHLYPEADIPVMQLSMPFRQPPAFFHELGRALAPLRNEGVLIVGSGSITHNLYEFAGDGRPTEAYVDAFRDWIADTLASDDTAALLDYRARAPFAERAHPTDEHLLPLMFARAAAGDGATVVRIAAEDVRYGMLGMDAYVFGKD
ncbi:MAG TPA: class III extradiol ring-cleavage dioxygenase [Aromatoleum sp.]|uniref:DODA-type extradiol aromatic ring-opening family dioxygenase n=1 Tax=Aromatoleum sp. TaxID=2307007 RepID=UPI002B4626C0|nr:class III extradiol ring-cleavage dioxygenase [Aromatoleum sp.]HJV28203.1 class III extradiol ring-cleavage dioxygenase [Aromatoleum sp.]